MYIYTNIMARESQNDTAWRKTHAHEGIPTLSAGTIVSVMGIRGGAGQDRQEE